jgi:hypothetical protein
LSRSAKAHPSSMSRRDYTGSLPGSGELRRLRGRRQRAQIGDQRRHVVRANLGIGGKRQRREQLVPVVRDARTDCALGFCICLIANTVRLATRPTGGPQEAGPVSCLIAGRSVPLACGSFRKQQLSQRDIDPARPEYRNGLASRTRPAMSQRSCVRIPSSLQGNNPENRPMALARPAALVR